MNTEIFISIFNHLLYQPPFDNDISIFKLQVT